MAYTVSFGTINKRENSTSQSYTEAVSASCLLKDSTDILRPTFSLAAQIEGDALLPCNYMYVAAFGRYYWITGIEFYHGTWYVSGEVDVLASYKSAIGNTQAYVLRAASQYDEYIPDHLFPFESNADVSGANYHDIGLDSEGTVLISCAGISDGTDSEVYYAISPSTWNRIYETFFTSQFMLDYKSVWTGLVDEFTNVVFRPEDYISNAIWIPVDLDDITGQRVRDITIGYTDTGLSGLAIEPSDLLYSGSVTIPIPSHLQRNTYGKWLAGNTARTIELYLPGYGTTILDSDALIDNSTIIVSWGVDCSGVIHYAVIQAGEKTSFFSANISTPVGWSSSRADLTGAISSIAGGLANPLNLIGSIGSAIQSTAPKVERMVAGGSRAIVSVSPYIRVSVTNYQLPSGLDFATTGRPLCKTVLISTLSGYVQCSETASVACAGTREEIDRINAYLAGGFYYE